MGLPRRIARARLASQVLKRLRRAGATGTRYDARAFAVRFTAAGADEPHVWQLDSLLAVRGRARRAQLDQFVSGLVRTPALPVAWQQACPLLRPVLRGATPAGAISTPLRRPVLPFLYEFVVVDQPDTMTYVGTDQPALWGVDAAEVFAAARANLAGAVLHGTATEPVVVQFVDDGDAYWTSHLLLDGWLARLSEQVGGVPVAFAPERGTLLVTADGSAHLATLFAQAEKVYVTSPRAITPMAYVSDARGATVPYAADEGHPMYDFVRRSAAVLAMQEYARQAESLEHAAPLELIDGVRTRTTWPGPGPALLPAADEVATGDAVTPWGELGDRLVPVPGLHPPRWRMTA